MHGHICNFIAEQPAQTQESRRIANDLFGRTECPIPFKLAVAAVHQRRRRCCRESCICDDAGRVHGVAAWPVVSESAVWEQRCGRRPHQS